MKKRIDSAKIIWKKYRKYKFRQVILKKLKILVKRKMIWKKFASK